MSLEFSDSALILDIKNKKHEIIYLNDTIIEIQDRVKLLLNSLQENDYNWISNNNFLVFNLVNCTIKLIKKYKKLNDTEKKHICFKIIEKFIEDEVGKLEIDVEMKKIVLHGIDTIVEPIIELTLLKLIESRNCLYRFLPCVKVKS